MPYFIASLYLTFLIGDWICTVILTGTLLYCVKYTFPEYLCKFLVAGGVSSFALLKVRWSSISLLIKNHIDQLIFLCIWSCLHLLNLDDTGNGSKLFILHIYSKILKFNWPVLKLKSLDFRFHSVELVPETFNLPFYFCVLYSDIIWLAHQNI